MTLALIALAVVSLLELAMYLPLVWSKRRVYSIGLLFLVAMVSGAVFTAHISLGSGAIVFIGVYRLFNLLRIIEGRMEPHFLHRTAWRTSVWLIGLQALSLLIWGFSEGLGLSWHSGLVMLASLQLVLAATLVLTTIQHLKRSRLQSTESKYADRDLPTVSVCVPARNETEALEACLGALVASDYPKLEILVLDDCSQDKTSEVIKSFAHAGVRFIKGTEAEGSWLAKNWAYQQLYSQASGELVLFCGVDVRLQPTSIRSLVVSLLEQQTRMISVIPHNQIPKTDRSGTSLLQPMRYGWELSLPRRLLKRPPVLSTCWLVQRNMIAEAGSFAAVRQSVTPESYFARFASQHDGYRFVRSDRWLGVTSQKTVAEQWQTAVRTRYPQLHRRPELVLCLAVLELAGVIATPLTLVYALLTSLWFIAALATAATLLYVGLYARLVATTYGRFLVSGLTGFPLAMSLDVYARHYSMIKYEFSEVNWKGRNICLPVMRIIPHLPKI